MDITNLNKKDKINLLIEEVKNKHTVFNLNNILFSDENSILSINELISFFEININYITHILYTTNGEYPVNTLIVNSIKNKIIIEQTQSIAFFDIIKANDVYHIRICIYDDPIKIKQLKRDENIDYILNKKNHSI